MIRPVIVPPGNLGDGICVIIPGDQEGLWPRDGAPPLKVYGMGILLRRREVVTCAHVIEAHRPNRLKGKRRVRVCFPFGHAWIDGSVDEDRWFPSDPTHDGTPFDIAIILLDKEAPSTVRRAYFEEHLPTETDVKSYGFPKKPLGRGDWHSHPTGLWAAGKIAGPLPEGRAQFDGRMTGSVIQGGYSGAAVYDAAQRSVIGMVVAAETDKTINVAQLIVTESLLKALGTSARVLAQEDAVVTSLQRAPGAGAPPPAVGTVAASLGTSATAFQNALEERRQWFGYLEAYKELHKSIHEIQAQWEPLLFAVDELKINNRLPIQIIHRVLNKNVIDAKRALNGVEDKDRYRWVLEDFEPAVSTLGDVGDGRNGDIDGALDHLDAVSNQQADLNAELVACITRLNLRDLAARVTTALSSITGHQELQDLLEEFGTSCRAVGDLVDRHKFCQRYQPSLDPRVHPNDVPSDIKSALPLIRDQLNSYCTTEDVPEAEAFEDAKRLQQALEAGKLAQSLDAFQVFCNSFSVFFQETDDQLLKETRKLVSHVKDLANLLGQVS